LIKLIDTKLIKYLITKLHLWIKFQEEGEGEMNIEIYTKSSDLSL